MVSLNSPGRFWFFLRPSKRIEQQGQRIYKKVGTQDAEHYILDGDRTVAVYQNGTIKYWNILAGGVVGRIEPGSGAKFYYLKDHLGSTRAVVNDGGTVVEAHDYYPYGLLMLGRDYQSGNETKEKFTGKERDAETGWDWFNPGRYYMPSLGRWLTTDPILFKMSPVDLISIGILGESPYVYISNNPIIYIDRQGLIKWKVVGKGTLKLLGGAVATGVSGYALVQTAGGAALFGATLGFTTGLATISLGLGEIISGFSDKDFPLSEGFIVSIASELGVDKKTSLKLAMAWDLLSVGQSAANVVSKTGTTLDELSLLLNAESLNEDIKAQIQEYLKSQEQKEKQEKEEEEEKE